MSLPRTDMLSASMVGFELAAERYRSVVQSPGSTAVAAFAPLFESLAWACSLDEAFKKLYGDAYTQALAADPVGPYVIGLRFARNRCTHQLALVAERDGLRLPFRLPATPGFLFRWRPVSELPEADAGHNHGIQQYEGWLVGDTADNTLRHVADWLRRAFDLFA